MVDLEAEAGLIIAPTYDALGWLAERLIRTKADVITVKNLDILLVNVLRKWKMKGDKRGTTLWAKGYLSFEDWEVQEWDDDYVGGIEHLNN